MTDLESFMVAHARLPWAWGAVDCSLALADWVMACGRLDPASEWRGAYHDEASWRRVVAENGGLLGVVAGVCRAAGLPPATVPSRGVIGVIGSGGRSDRQWGAIHDGSRWRVRSAQGFVPLIARPLAMWSV